MRPMPIGQTAPRGPWPEGILPVHCFECRLPLCISMPREEFPKRLVGTCVGCRARYVIAWTADGTEALIGRLPDERTTRPTSALPDVTDPPMINGHSPPSYDARLGPRIELAGPVLDSRVAIVAGTRPPERSALRVAPAEQNL